MDNPKVTILAEKTIPVQGTTRLEIFDKGYDQSGSNSEFHGNISSAPLGLLRLRRVRVDYPGLSWEQYDVDIFQASWEDVLNSYAGGKHYPDQVKKIYELSCETASFFIKTKYGSELFSTDGDGDYGKLYHMKQYFGMILHLEFDDDMFSFEELEDKFLKLFKKRKAASCA